MTPIKIYQSKDESKYTKLPSITCTLRGIRKFQNTSCDIEMLEKYWICWEITDFELFGLSHRRILMHGQLTNQAKTWIPAQCQNRSTWHTENKLC